MQLQPPPQKFLSTLLEVRDYYAPLVEKYGKLYREALENLNHVEALLSNWPLTLEVDSNRPKQEVSEEIFTFPIQKSLNGNSSNVSKTESEFSESQDTDLPQVNNLATENVSSQNKEDINLPLNSSEPAGVVDNLFHSDSEDISQAETKFDESTNADEPPATNSEVTVSQENISLDNSDYPLETASELVEPSITESQVTNSTEIKDDSASGEEDELPASTSTSETKAAQTPNKSSLGPDIPMLDEYQSLRRIEAVQKLLQKHTGSVCHIDFVVRSLYGELEPDVRKVVKGRVQSTLTQGRESGKWSLVPGKPGYYTIDLKLLNSPRKDSSSKQSNSKSKKPDPKAKTNSIPMQREFDGKFLIDAITSLLEQNPKKVFDVAEVINKLYGKLTPEQVQEVKPSVLNELSRGYRTGRFSKVPEEKGLYIWDSNFLPQINRK